MRLEYFYRELRRKHDILMNGREPEGGKWNYDADNRGSFGKTGPGKSPTPKRFHPDATTKEVIDLVERKFSKHPGKLDHFDWPVTPKQARQALADFIDHRLPRFGEYQDAMWTDEPYLYRTLAIAFQNRPTTSCENWLASYLARRFPLFPTATFCRNTPLTSRIRS